MYIKCHCGFQESPEKEEEVCDFYVRGPKKGQMKNRRTVTKYGRQMETITVVGYKGSSRGTDLSLEFKVCPDCNLMYYDGWF